MFSSFKIDETKKQEQLDALFTYWRQQGFPDYSKEDYDYKKELSKLILFEESNILRGKDLEQTMHGCGFLWTYFPHWVNIECGNLPSLITNWNDDECLKKLLKLTYEYEQKHNKGVFTLNRLRQNAKVYCSKQSVSNFRPTVAKYIYNTYGNNGTVWDMSSGFGGRLLGFLSSNCGKYIGTDPSTPTYNGLMQMKQDFAYVGKEVELNCMGSEDYIPEDNSLDLCFTSPPYFNTEKYSNEPTQSYIKYPTQGEWINGFFRTTCQNCYKGLKPGRYMIVNIASVKSFPDLAERAVECAESVGFTLDDTLYLILSSISGKGKKREPVFIFKK